MPGPGERDDDDLVGFSSPASLEGRRREASSDEPRPAPAQAQTQGTSSDAFAPRPPGRPPRPAESPRRPLPEETPDAFRLYTVYALMLLTVPTLGAAGGVALLAVWRRGGMGDALAETHAVFQKRTLLATGAAGVAGVVLMAAPFALGVPVLFLTALWLILRSAVGVWLLKSGRAIQNPRGWWI